MDSRNCCGIWTAVAYGMMLKLGRLNVLITSRSLVGPSGTEGCSEKYVVTAFTCTGTFDKSIVLVSNPQVVPVVILLNEGQTTTKTSAPRFCCLELAFAMRV